MIRSSTKLLLGLAWCWLAWPQAPIGKPGSPAVQQGAATAGAQPAPDWRPSLARIRSVAQTACEQRNDSGCATLSFTEKVSDGLAGRWDNHPGWQKTALPKEYAQNLDVLATQLESIARQADPSDAKDGRLGEALSFVSNDLQAKYADCLKFGMGRNIPVTLRTIGPNHAPDPGWEVFYTCAFEGFMGTEMRVPDLTETTISLPPAALCTFRARKAGRDVQVGQTGIFGQPTQVVAIPVP